MTRALPGRALAVIFGLAEYDYERNLNVLPRIDELELLEHVDVNARQQLPRSRSLCHVRAPSSARRLVERAVRDRSFGDRRVEVDTLEAAVLFPIGARVDLEVNLGSGRSEFFDAGLYGGLLFLVYGR